MLSRLIRTSLVAALAMLLTAAAVSTPATATTGDGLANLPAVTPVMRCADVTGLDLSGATDAAVTLSSATIVAGNAPYCEVRGTIAPANTIVVRLPVNGWTQRYVQTGCGGLCGNANINYTQAATCEPIANGTIASATTDMGHQGGSNGSWAANNPQAQIDFSYRGVHATAQVAKALIKAFYHFDPNTLRCEANQDPSTCLSAAEATVVQRLHDGATDAEGRRLEPAIAHEWGSELEWTLVHPHRAGPGRRQ